MTYNEQKIAALLTRSGIPEVDDQGCIYSLYERVRLLKQELDLHKADGVRIKWTDKQESQFSAFVRQNMASTYESVLGPQAHDLSDAIGRGIAKSVSEALQDLGMRPRS